MIKRLCVSFFLIGLAVILHAAPVHAQDAEPNTGRDMAAEEAILERLASANPDAVPIFRQATENMDRDNLQQAIAGYQEVLSLVPDFPDALRRLASCELEAGLQALGREHAERAYNLDPSGFNAAVFGLALLLDPNASDYTATTLRLGKEAVEANPEDALSNHVLMYAAGQANDINALRDAAGTLARIAPSHAGAHFYLGLLAAREKNWLEAEKQLGLAAEFGYPEDQITGVMIEANVAMHVAQVRATQIAIYAFAAWLVGMAVLFLLGIILSNLTLIAANPNRPDIRMEPGSAEKTVRAIYRAVISLTSIYFYISIPFLILLVVGIGAGIVYLFFQLGRIPTRIVLYVGLAVVYTLYAILRSLFTRIRDRDPGRPLNQHEAPALWALTRAVAEKLETRPIETIFITPGTEIAVMEKGGVWNKLSGKGRRSLILGLGVLPGMTQGPFKAILAHEYGHFRGKDTAGGNLAHQVQASIQQLAYGLATTGQARWYNPAWLFINGFYRLFLRITHGASRLQEILADRYAALAYGTRNMVAGLTHVIRISTVFDIKVNKEVKGSLAERRQLNNVYTLPDLTGEGVEGKIEELVQKSIQRETSTYDTHPSPAVRFQMIEKLHPDYMPGPDDERPVIDLIPNAAGLQAEMTGQIQKNLEMRMQVEAAKAASKAASQAAVKARRKN